MIQCVRRAADAAAKGADEERLAYVAKMLELALDDWADVVRKLTWAGELLLHPRWKKNGKVKQWRKASTR